MPDLIISDSEIALGDVSFVSTIELRRVKSLLGPPSRTTQKRNKILTYDTVGLHLLVGRDQQVLELNVAFEPGWYDFSPTTAFAGTVEVLGVRLASVDDFLAAGRNRRLVRDEEEGDGFVELWLQKIHCTLQIDKKRRTLIDLGVNFV